MKQPELQQQRYEERRRQEKEKKAKQQRYQEQMERLKLEEEQRIQQLEERKLKFIQELEEHRLKRIQEQQQELEQMLEEERLKEQNKINTQNKKIKTFIKKLVLKRWKNHTSKNCETCSKTYIILKNKICNDCDRIEKRKQIISDESELKYLLKMKTKLQKANNKSYDRVDFSNTYYYAYKNNMKFEDPKYIDYCAMKDWESNHIHDLGRLEKYIAL
jgi:hypothetical protein